MSDLLNHPALKEKKYLVIFLGCLNFILFFGYFAFQFAAESATSQRRLASLPSLREEHLTKTSVGQPQLSKYSKHLSTIQIEIQPLNEIPKSDSDELELKALIRVQRDLGGQPLSYRWIPDSGVTVLSGNLEGQLLNMNPSQEHELRILVKGFSKEYSRLVRLEAFLPESEIKVGNAALVHSRPEDSYEFIAPLVHMSIEESKRQQKQARGIANDKSEGKSPQE